VRTNGKIKWRAGIVQGSSGLIGIEGAGSGEWRMRSYAMLLREIDSVANRSRRQRPLIKPTKKPE